MEPQTSSGLNRRLLIALILSLLVLCALAVLGGVALSGVLTFREQLLEQQALVEQLQQKVTETEQKLQQAEADAAGAGETAAQLQQQLDAARQELADAQKKLDEANSRLAAGSPSAEGTAATYPADAKLIALTFDDGPGKNTTPRLLDELKKRGAKATFFVVGSNAKKYPDLIRRMAEEGHAIGNHSYSHQNLVKADEATMKEQILRCAELIQTITGHMPTLLRPPGGNFDDRLQTYAKETGLSLVNWTVDTRDWKTRDKEAILAAAFQTGTYGIQDGAIVLMHDVYESTVDAAVEMMDRLQEQGYILVTVPELLRVRCGGAQAGVLYYSDSRSHSIG